MSKQNDIDTMLDELSAISYGVLLQNFPELIGKYVKVLEGPLQGQFGTIIDARDSTLYVSLDGGSIYGMYKTCEVYLYRSRAEAMLDALDS